MELGSLWQEQAVVIFFLRRFGCQICRWTASEVSKLEPSLKANGVALVGVGPEEVGLEEFKAGGFLKGGEQSLQAITVMITKQRFYTTCLLTHVGGCDLI